eukprot:UN00122
MTANFVPTHCLTFFMRNLYISNTIGEGIDASTMANYMIALSQICIHYNTLAQKVLMLTFYLTFMYLIDRQLCCIARSFCNFEGREEI